jgi:hypothetical protein
MEAAARPLPKDESTPPVIKINFVFLLGCVSIPLSFICRVRVYGSKESAAPVPISFFFLQETTILQTAMFDNNALCGFRRILFPPK